MGNFTYLKAFQGKLNTIVPMILSFEGGGLYEDDLSTKSSAKKKRTWFQKENENEEWTKHFTKT